MPHFIIHCPRTASTVDVWVPKSTSGTKPDEYEAVTCPACTRLHFVHKITGKLLGETDVALVTLTSEPIVAAICPEPREVSCVESGLAASMRLKRS
jgi:hypothetical protein